MAGLNPLEDCMWWPAGHFIYYSQNKCWNVKHFLNLECRISHFAEIIEKTVQKIEFIKECVAFSIYYWLYDPIISSTLWHVFKATTIRGVQHGVWTSFTPCGTLNLPHMPDLYEQWTSTLSSNNPVKIASHSSMNFLPLPTIYNISYQNTLSSASQNWVIMIDS